jgi:hypothetical protein
MTKEQKKAAKAAIALTRKMLSRLGPEAWLAQIQTIKDDEIAVRTANIIWYDWFSERVASERWNQLDLYLSFYTEAVKEQTSLQEALFTAKTMSDRRKLRKQLKTYITERMALVKAELIRLGYHESMAVSRTKICQAYKPPRQPSSEDTKTASGAHTP